MAHHSSAATGVFVALIVVVVRGNK
jgi:hypothetical protein